MIAFILCAIATIASCQHATAPHCTGLDVDGTADDWAGCNAPQVTFTMRQIPVVGNNNLQNSLRVQFAHDDTHIYVLAQIKAPYYYNLTTGNNHLAHSMAVMWKVGALATMLNMGGCPVPLPASNDPYDCPAIQTICENNPSMCVCTDYVTDVWHMESSSPGSLPGVRYPWRGSYDSLGYGPPSQAGDYYQVERLFSGNDHTSNSDDELSVHPCLRGDDGGFRATPGQRYRNQLRYAWSHSAIDSFTHPFSEMETNGTYIYEFARPLVTKEDSDAQFAVGGNASFAFAFWMPSEPAANEGWENADHYVAPSDFQFGTVQLVERATPCACDVNSKGDGG